MAPITVSALGRVAEIGDFYDAVNDVFIPCNLFDQKIPRDCVTVKPTHSVNSRFYFTNTTEEKMRIWDIQGDISLSVASGMLKIVGGSATYLNERRGNSRSMHCVFAQHVEHELVKLNTSYQELANKIAVGGIATGATHVVVEILNGSDAFVEISCDADHITTETAAKGQIDMGFSTFGGVWKQFWDTIWKKKKGNNEEQGASEQSIGDGHPTIQQTPSTSSENQPKQEKKLIDKGIGIGWKTASAQVTTNVRMKIFADAYLEEGLTPTSLEEAQDIIKRFAHSVQEGKHITPLRYTLLDVKEVARIFNIPLLTDVIYNPMSNSQIDKCKHLLTQSEEHVLKISEFANRLKESSASRILPQERMNAVIKKQQDVAVFEKDLQLKIAKLARNLRSSERSDELIMEFGEKLAGLNYSYLSSADVDKFLEENRDLDRFMKFIDTLRSLDVIFIDAIEDFWDMKKKEKESYFLVFSLADLSAKDDLWENTRSQFLSLCVRKDTLCATVITHMVPEITKLTPTENGPKIFITNDGSYQTKDLLSDLETIAKFNIVTPTEDHLPSEKNVLSLVCAKLKCPNFLCSVPNEREWYCSICYKVLEYDFEDHFYCKCGRLPTDKFRFKCNSKNHGNSKIPYPPLQLKEQLKKHAPYKNVNILFIGETGTGKTTLINSLPTYLTYSSFEKAQKEPLKVLVDFQLSRPVIKEKLVETRRMFFQSDESNIHGQVTPLEPNEVFLDGKSSTRMPRSHYFKHEDTVYHIIDTPGIGDTGGPEQDTYNVQNIIRYLCNLEKIHLICFVVPADTPRVTERFKYCFTELISRFHKSAIGNFAFCITKAGINFDMGNTSICLLNMVENIKKARDIIVPLQQNNIFIFDNSGWLDMAAAAKYEIEMEDEQLSRKKFHRSRNDVLRLMQQASTCQPHITNDTKQIHLARTTIQRLSGHLNLIGENVHRTACEMQIRRDMIEQLKGNEEELMKILKKKVKIYRGHIRGGFSVLCEECERKLKEDSKIHWSVSWTRISLLLYTCACVPLNPSIPVAICTLTYAMTITRKVDRIFHKIMNPKCSECNNDVSGKLKLFIRRYVVEKEKEEIDIVVERSLRGFQDKEHEVELLIKANQDFLNEIESEKSSINTALSKFAYFLKEHGIVPYNDFTDEYLSMALNEERKTAGLSKKYETFTRMKEEYNEEKKALLLDSVKLEEITIKNVLSVVEELKTLKHYGKDIEEALKEVNDLNIEIHGTFYDPKGQLPYMARIGAFIKTLYTMNRTK